MIFIHRACRLKAKIASRSLGHIVPLIPSISSVRGLKQVIDTPRERITIYRGRATTDEGRATVNSSKSPSRPIRVVCVSDTHNRQPVLPDGDVLLHAGDLSRFGSLQEIQTQLNWLKKHPHKHKVVIGGNHDLFLDRAFVSRFPKRVPKHGISRTIPKWDGIIYLCNKSVRLNFPTGRSLKIYGSPWTEQYDGYRGQWAFQHPPDRDVWARQVPPDTDILLTHGPPKGHLDRHGLGSAFLLREIWRAKPRLVVFGHVHGGYGRKDVTFDAVQAAYDRVLLAEKGLFAVFGMVCSALIQRLLAVMPFSRRRDGSKTATFVNAAVVAGPYSRLTKPPVTVEI